MIKSRPLVVETINDANSEAALSPSHQLTKKSKVVMPPLGVFETPDLYCKKRWRRLQHISNEFWRRTVKNSWQPYKKGKTGCFLKETLGL